MIKNKTIWLAAPGLILLGLSGVVSRTESNARPRAETDEEARRRTGASALRVQVQPTRTIDRSRNDRSAPPLLLTGAETNWNGLYKPAGRMNGAVLYRRDPAHYLAFNGKGHWGLAGSPHVINTPIAKWTYYARGAAARPPAGKWMRMRANNES